MVKTTPIYLSGPAGNIEAVWNEVGIDLPTDAAALVCHPHPLFDGTMHNKVVSTLVRTFGDLGVPSLKFNFRGVGASDGEYASGVGEVKDARACLDWLQQEHGIERFYLAGFSFGSFIASSLAHQLAQDEKSRLAHLVVVAPPVHNFDFGDLFPADYPSTIIVSDADEVVPPEDVYHWLDSVYPPLDVIEMPGASHFFHGRLTELKRLLIQRLTA